MVESPGDDGEPVGAEQRPRHGEEHFVLTTNVGSQEIHDLECQASDAVAIPPVERIPETCLKPPEDLVLLEKGTEWSVFAQYGEQGPFFILVVPPHGATEQSVHLTRGREVRLGRSGVP